MNDAQRTLRAEWSRVERSRLAVLVRAQCAVMARRCTVLQVCEALGMSPPTWRRLVRRYGLGELAVDVVATVDRELRRHGATEAAGVGDVKAAIDNGNMDLENSLLGVGVVRRGGQ